MTTLDARTWTAARAQLAKASKPPPGPVEWAASHGISLWSAQRTIAKSVEINDHVAVRAAHAVGKTFTAAVLCCWWVDTHPDSMFISTAPTRDQVHGILWKEIAALHTRLRLPGRVVTGTDEWKIGGIQYGIGRKPPDNAAGSDFDPATFQGYHRAGGVLVVIDEASGVPEWLWNAVETVTTTSNCRILAIGNPDNPGSHFARVCSPMTPGWTQHKIMAADSPNFTGEQVPDFVKAPLVDEAWVAKRREEWGEDSHLFVSKVLAEFPSDHPRQVVSLVDLLACQFPDVQPAHLLLPVELGVDVGGGGDWTVIRERRGVRAGRQWKLRSDRPEEISPLILRAIHETGATRVKVDSIGVGFNVVGELRNMARRGDHHAEVVGIGFGEAATDPLKFRNKRAEVWWEIGRVGSQKREWDLSAMEGAETTIAQLTQPRYFEDVKGRIQIEEKDDIRARTGSSPDEAEALLYAYASDGNSQKAFFEAMASGRLRG